MANPIATLILALISVPQLLGVLFWDDFPTTVWCTLGVGILFVLTYVLGINTAKRSRANN